MEFLNGDRDSVLRFQEKNFDLIQDKYVYIAYLQIYAHKQKYVKLLKEHQ